MSRRNVLRLILYNPSKHSICGGVDMDRLEAFEQMLESVRRQSDYESEQMGKLKAAGKEKTATYRQLFANRMLYKKMLDKYREFGLID